MVEHMHRGNRMGNTFNKQEWVDMLLIFISIWQRYSQKPIYKFLGTVQWYQKSSWTKWVFLGWYTTKGLSRWSCLGYLPRGTLLFYNHYLSIYTQKHVYLCVCMYIWICLRQYVLVCWHKKCRLIRMYDHIRLRQCWTSMIFVCCTYTAADGRYNRSSHDIDNDDEIQVAICACFLLFLGSV